MLVLSREVNQKVVIAAGTPYETIVSVVRISGCRVRIGFEADLAVDIHRLEVQRKINREQGQG